MRYGSCLLSVLVVLCCTLLLKHYYQTSYSCTEHSHLDYKQQNTPPSPTKYLIIVAEARSGSTWLGSFFKENENVLHFFEPLDDRVFSKAVNTSTLSNTELLEMQLSVLSNECTCRFNKVKYPSMGVLPSWSKSLHRMQGYLTKDGKVLPQYKKPKSKDLAAKLKMKTPNLIEAEELCKKVDLVSAKIIRLFDISHLSRLPEFGCQEFKILHLVRDPRPIIQSRMSVFGELHTGNEKHAGDFARTEIRDVAKSICENFVRNVRVGLSAGWGDRYKVVRYEDIASDPLKYAEVIYNYVGLTLTPPIRDHILQTSQGSRVAGKFEVVRNTSEVLHNWKRVMDTTHVKIVESQCTEMFRTFGYQTL